MTRRIPFVKNELQAIDYIPGFLNSPPSPLRNTPVTSKENVAAMFYDKHPYWCPIPVDSSMLFTPLYNDQLGRGSAKDITDAFGIEWEYIETAGGSIVRPGEPFMADANEWKDKIKFPNIDEWDWAGAVEKDPLNRQLSNQLSFVNGFWFERLISLMDFAPAAMALIDDDQKPAIHELFEAMTEFAMKLVDKFVEYWPGLDGFNVHDDWGSQKAPFFSQQTAYELFVPYMKALTDHIHSKGRFATLHSCGHTETRIQCYIDGGFDSWGPQLMNDTHALYEEYGDKIIIGVVPTPFDPETTSEEEQRRLARAHADRFCKPGKPSEISNYGRPALTTAFSDELYEYTRKLYGGF